MKQIHVNRPFLIYFYFYRIDDILPSYFHILIFCLVLIFLHFSSYFSHFILYKYFPKLKYFILYKYFISLFLCFYDLFLSEESNLDQPTSEITINHSRNNKNNNNNNGSSSSNQEMSYGISGPSSEVVFGGGELTRKSSIYPGHGNSDYATQQSTGGLLSTNTSLSLLNGVSMDRQDSDNFSWSGLFSINSIDGYGLMSTSTDNNNFSLASPGGSLNLSNTINSINENNRVKTDEDVREIKSVKRGIAEIGINDGNHYVNDKNGDNRDYNARRQKLSVTCPPINSQSSNINLHNIGNTILNCSTNSTNNNNLNQIQNLGSGSMDPPHGYYSQSSNESAQFGKQETSEPFYSNLQRSNPSEVSYDFEKVSFFYYLLHFTHVEFLSF